MAVFTSLISEIREHLSDMVAPVQTNNSPPEKKSKLLFACCHIPFRFSFHSVPEKPSVFGIQFLESDPFLNRRQSEPFRGRGKGGLASGPPGAPA